MTKIILPEPNLITDPNELRLTVDPSHTELEAYSKGNHMRCTPVYARQPFPTEITATAFLAGPTYRDKTIGPSWRIEALRLLDEAGFRGHVFIPENPDNSFNDWDGKFPYEEQVRWEEEALNRADCILFWIPRDEKTLPGFTTNDEFGTWKHSGKVVLGTPPEAPKVRYQRHFAAQHGIPTCDTLEESIIAVVSRLGSGARRTGGECEVPLLIWNTESFQSWYTQVKAARNRLDGARVLWSFRVGPKKDFVFAWVLHVNVYIWAENRSKTNEFVFARSDISSVLLYHQAANPKDTELLLVHEFRAPASTTDGFIHELPGGSSTKKSPPENVVLKELAEETGFDLEPDRLVYHGVRQLAGTLSAHKGHLFSAELTAEEWGKLRAEEGQLRGVELDTERTYTEIITLAELLGSNNVDWSTVGMIMKVLGERKIAIEP